MIQRIQTIFLLLGSSTMGLFTLSPIGKGEQTLAGYYSDSVFYPSEDLSIVAASLTTSIVILASIFFYKNRKLQTIVCILGSTFSLITLVLSLYLYNYTNSNSANSLGWGIGIPVIVLIFTILALINIRKDDKLIKSMDRLR